MKATTVSSSGFGGAAGFTVFKLWVQEGTTQSALIKACPCSVAKSFLDIGEKIVTRENTSRPCAKNEVNNYWELTSAARADESSHRYIRVNDDVMILWSVTLICDLELRMTIFIFQR